MRALAKPGQPLAPDSPNATINNPQWFRRGRDSQLERRAVRVRLHEKLKEDYLRRHPAVRQDRRAVVLAGPPGAGKSTALKSVLGNKTTDYLTIDADEFKRALLEEARRDGSYETHILPDAVRQLQLSGEAFYPLELSSLVHEESSMLAKQLREDAIDRGDNVIIDSVLSSPEAALQLGSILEAAGYAIELIDVEVPYELSEQRIAARWRESYEEALTQTPGADLGGRWVPSEYARNVFDGPDGKSRPEAVAEQLANECAAVTRFKRFRTVLDAAGTPVGPTLETDMVRETRNAALVPAATTRDAKASAARDFAQGQLRPTRSHQKTPPAPKALPQKNPGRKPGKDLDPGREAGHR
ncbi:zeta toxin family protein [Pseudarthrobacter sp. NPDC089323]